MPTSKSTLTSKDNAKSNKANPAEANSLPGADLVHQTKSRRFLKWCLITSLKVMLILIVTLGIYSIYLDGKVRNKFEGQRWQIPIQVFGKIEQLQINTKTLYSRGVRTNPTNSEPCSLNNVRTE